MASSRAAASLGMMWGGGHPPDAWAGGREKEPVLWIFCQYKKQVSSQSPILPSFASSHSVKNLRSNHKECLPSEIQASHIRSTLHIQYVYTALHQKIGWNIGEKHGRPVTTWWMIHSRQHVNEAWSPIFSIIVDTKVIKENYLLYIVHWILGICLCLKSNVGSDYTCWGGIQPCTDDVLSTTAKLPHARQEEPFEYTRRKTETRRNIAYPTWWSGFGWRRCAKKVIHEPLNWWSEGEFVVVVFILLFVILLPFSSSLAGVLSLLVSTIDCCCSLASAKAAAALSRRHERHGHIYS